MEDVFLNMTPWTREPDKNVSLVTLKICNYFDVKGFSYNEEQHLKF